MQQHLAKLGKVQTVEWIHWQTGQASKNWPEAELAKIEVLVKQPVVIVAKSIGTLIAVKFIAADPKLVDAVVLCGIPVNDIGQKELNAYQSLNKLDPEKIICLQNDRDPHGTADQVSRLFTQLELGIKVIGKPADNHDYLYFGEIQAFLTSNQD